MTNSKGERVPESDNKRVLEWGSEKGYRGERV